MHTGSCVDEKTVGRRPVRIHTHGSTRGMLSSHLRPAAYGWSLPLHPFGHGTHSSRPGPIIQAVWMWSHSHAGAWDREGGNRQRQTPLYALLLFRRAREPNPRVLRRTVPAHKYLARKPGTGRISAARHLLTTISFYYNTALNCWRCSSSSASCMLLREIR
jgi:hypothetical protein